MSPPSQPPNGQRNDYLRNFNLLDDMGFDDLLRAIEAVANKTSFMARAPSPAPPLPPRQQRPQAPPPPPPPSPSRRSAIGSPATDAQRDRVADDGSPSVELMDMSAPPKLPVKKCVGKATSPSSEMVKQRVRVRTDLQRERVADERNPTSEIMDMSAPPKLPVKKPVRKATSASSEMVEQRLRVRTDVQRDRVADDGNPTAEMEISAPPKLPVKQTAGKAMSPSSEMVKQRLRVRKDLQYERVAAERKPSAEMEMTSPPKLPAKKSASKATSSSSDKAKQLLRSTWL